MEKPNITLNALNYANSKFKRDDDPKGWDAAYYGYIEGAELISELLEGKVESIKEKTYEDMSVSELIKCYYQNETTKSIDTKRVIKSLKHLTKEEEQINDSLKIKSETALESKIFKRVKFGVKYWAHDIIHDRLRVTFRYYISEEDFRNGSRQMFGYFYIKDDLTKSV